jgi:ATP-dependent helicase HrpA
MKQLEKDLSGQSRSLGQAFLQLHPLIKPEILREDILNTITDRAFIGNDSLPRTEKEFAEQRQRARARLPAVTGAVVRTIQTVAAEIQVLLARLSGTGVAGGKGGMTQSSVLRESTARLKAELNAQLRNLIYPGFLEATPWEKLNDLPRYLKGMLLRLDKYPGNPERDQRHARAIASLWQQYEQRLEHHGKAGISDPMLAEFRWQIEELRISLFAQELKTPYPVSVKRLQKLWQEVTA